ncbi:MAG: YceH family protein [Motiliproteus sp.]
MELSQTELRVIGSLIEKEITTPDQYPLSLNALVAACNQKTNRDPVMELDELGVQQTLDALSKSHLVSEESVFSSRVAKYKHRFCNTEFSELQLSSQQLAIICVLFLRGPQTPGELRTRCNRLCDFYDIESVESALADLMEHSQGAFVVKLAREPGKRESRFAHCFGDGSDMDQYQVCHEETPSSRPSAQQAGQSSGQIRATRLEERVDELEAQVSRLNEDFYDLKSKLQDLLK